MHARTLSALLLSILICGHAGAFAETEREAEAEATAPRALPAQSTKPAFVIEPADFRRPSMGNGTFDQPSSAAFKAFGVGMFVTAGADLASTELGLSRPGVYEMNPVQGNRNVRILTHVAAPAFMYWVTEKLHDKGKTKTALFARIGFNVAYSYVVMHNLRSSGVNP